MADDRRRVGAIPPIGVKNDATAGTAAGTVIRWGVLAAGVLVSRFRQAGGLVLPVKKRGGRRGDFDRRRYRVCSWSVSASSLRTLFLTGEDTPVLMYEDTPFMGRRAARPGKIEPALPDVVEPGLAEV
jgi:hypothetical protein